jgi:hypothetical protein
MQLISMADDNLAMKFIGTILVTIVSWLVAGPAMGTAITQSTHTASVASVGALFPAQPLGAQSIQTSTTSVGNRLVTKKALTVTGMRFWRTSGSDTRTRTAFLANSTGVVLARASITPAVGTAAGWVQGSFAAPISLSSAQVVTAAITIPARVAVRTAIHPSSANVTASYGVYSSAGAAVPATKYSYLFIVDLLVAAPVSTPSTPTPTPPSSTTTGSTTDPSVFPSAATVGWRVTGAALTPYRGPNEITQDGTVIDGADITVPLIISANNVTIRNSRVTSPTDWYVIRQYPEYSHLTLQNVELVNQSGAHPDWAIYAGPYLTVTNSLIHGMQRGIYASDNMTVSNSYLDDFDNPSTSHAQAILSSGNIHNVRLTNNTLGCGTNMCTAALSIFPETWTGGPNDHWFIDHNLLNGGSYALYAGYSASSGESPNTYMTFTNNTFGAKYFPTCGEYGYVASWSDVPTNVWSNNINAVGGQISAP